MEEIEPIPTAIHNFFQQFYSMKTMEFQTLSYTHVTTIEISVKTYWKESLS